MFNIKKALLSTLIISALAVQTTQPIDFSWITSNSIYRQGTELCSRLNINKNVILATTLLISAVLAYKLYSLRNKQEPITDEHIIPQPIDKNPAVLNHRFAEELNKISFRWKDIEQLITDGADANTAAKQNGYTALHFAVVDKNIKMITFLLNHHADPMQANNDGIVPLGIAKDILGDDETKLQIIELLNNSLMETSLKFQSKEKEEPSQKYSEKEKGKELPTKQKS